MGWAPTECLENFLSCGSSLLYLALPQLVLEYPTTDQSVMSKKETDGKKLKKIKMDEKTRKFSENSSISDHTSEKKSGYKVFGSQINYLHKQQTSRDLAKKMFIGVES